jgi:Ni,Fe-hydrogenase I small subunit
MSEKTYWLKKPKSNTSHIVGVGPKGKPHHMSRCGAAKISKGQMWDVSEGMPCQRCSALHELDGYDEPELMKPRRQPLPVSQKAILEAKAKDSQWASRKGAPKIHRVVPGEVASFCGLARANKKDPWVVKEGRGGKRCAKCQEKYMAALGKKAPPKPKTSLEAQVLESVGGVMVPVSDLKIVVEYLENLRGVKPNEGHIENNIRESIILDLKKYMVHNR